MFLRNLQIFPPFLKEFPKNFVFFAGYKYLEKERLRLW